MNGPSTGSGHPRAALPVAKADSRAGTRRDGEVD